MSRVVPACALGLASLALTVLALYRPIAIAQTAPATPLALTLMAQPTEVRQGGRIALVFSWHNQSLDQTIVLRGQPGPNATSGLELRLVDPAGAMRVIPPQPARLSAQQVADGARRVELPPQVGFGVVGRYAATTLFNGPGRDELFAVYRSPNPTAGAAVVGALEAQSATSERIVVEMLP